MTDGRRDIRWARRVPKWKVRRLYESDARGMRDEELLDDVGTTLWLRCRDIVAVLEAREGRVKCHRCARQNRHTVIHRELGRKGDPRDELLTCPVCGWQITWGDYHLSFKRKQLNSGGATTAFETFARDYPHARTPREKVLAVDRLIHEFHYSYKDRPDLATRPIGVNLIEGRIPDVVRFLDELTYGRGTSPAVIEHRAAWRGKIDRIDWIDLPPAGSKSQGDTPARESIRDGKATGR